MVYLHLHYIFTTRAFQVGFQDLKGTIFSMSYPLPNDDLMWSLGSIPGTDIILVFGVGGAGRGAQRSVLRVYKLKKTGMWGARANSAAKTN